MGKVQGDGMAEGLEWQAEVLGPHFPCRELAHWTCCECPSLEWRGVAAIYLPEPKAHLRSTAAGWHLWRTPLARYQTFAHGSLVLPVKLYTVT